MSRPFIKIQWATAEVNFPAGGNPWNGQPVLHTPGLDYFTPGAALPAEDLNYALNAATGASAGIINQVGQIDGMNWKGYVSYTQRVAWDPAYGRWITSSGGTGGGAESLSVSYDGSSPSNIGSNTTTHGVARLQVRASDGTIVAMTSDAINNTFFETFTPSGTSGSWNTPTTGPTASLAYTGIGSTFFGPYTVWIVPNVSSTVTHIYSYIPSNLAFNTGSGGSPIGHNPPVEGQFTFANDGTTLAVFSSASGTNYYTTTDTLTWTSQNLPTLASTENVVGADYDAGQKIWRVVTSGTGGTTHVWQASTPTGTWTQIGSFGHQVYNATFSGSEILGIMNVGGQPRMAVSTDGGNTWYWSKVTPPLSTGVVETTTNGFLYWDKTNYNTTFAVGQPSIGI